VGDGPIVIGFDGSPAATLAVREAGGLAGPRPALVVVVGKLGLADDVRAEAVRAVGLPPAPLDVRTAEEFDRATVERAQALARQGAELARDAGLEAEGLAVADDADTPVAETLVALARERVARAVVVGAHVHGGIIGATTRTLLREAPCPALIVRGPAA
jgi:nucleotide-binding universal stress UspA family protein